jgi:hypothetical protein
MSRKRHRFSRTSTLRSAWLPWPGWFHDDSVELRWQASSPDLSVHRFRDSDQTFPVSNFKHPATIDYEMSAGPAFLSPLESRSWNDFDQFR